MSRLEELLALSRRDRRGLVCCRNGSRGVCETRATSPTAGGAGLPGSRVTVPTRAPRPAARTARVATSPTRRATRPPLFRSARGGKGSCCRCRASRGAARTSRVIARMVPTAAAQESQRRRCADKRARSSCESSPSRSSEAHARARSQPLSCEPNLPMYGLRRSSPRTVRRPPAGGRRGTRAGTSRRRSGSDPLRRAGGSACGSSPAPRPRGR
jgi:hypothetical protein